MTKYNEPESVHENETETDDSSCIGNIDNYGINQGCECSFEDNICTKNSNVHTAWTRNELEELHSLSFHKYTIKEMSNILTRPKKQVLKALRRLQTQQCIHHDMCDVAAFHNMSPEKLVKRLGDPLYYVPIQSNGLPPLLVITTVLFGIVSLYGYTCYTP